MILKLLQSFLMPKRFLMKRIILYYMLFLCFFNTIINAASPTISAGTIAIPLQEITKYAHQNILDRAPEYEAREGIRGASNTVALILNGLAQTCSHVSQALPQNPLQQVVLGTVASSLATAAAVIIDRKQQRDQKKADRTQLAKVLTDFTIQLEQAGNGATATMPTTALFTSLKSIKSPANKQTFIRLILDEATLSDDFVFDCINIAEDYFTTHEDALTKAIKICVGVVFIDWLSKQQPTQHESVIDLVSAQKDGLIMYTPSDTGNELPELVEQVASIVTTRLLTAYATMMYINS